MNETFGHKRNEKFTPGYQSVNEKLLQMLSINSISLEIAVINGMQFRANDDINWVHMAFSNKFVRIFSEVFFRSFSLFSIRLPAIYEINKRSNY